jgi:hypothetical protein
MQGIVDRIEEDIVVIEIEGTMYNVDIELLEDEISEGDVVDVEFWENEIVSVTKDYTQTQKREEYIEQLTRDMWE